jgi:hypothetical protein
MSEDTGEENFTQFKDFEIDKMNRNLAYWEKNFKDDSLAKKNFYLFFSEHDRRRGTSFLKAFPEMEEFWKECSLS